MLMLTREDVTMRIREELLELSAQCPPYTCIL